MIINDANLASLRTNLRREFQTGLDMGNGQVFHREIAMRVPSTTKSNTYGWLSKFPKMREWVGDRVLKDLAEDSYVIANKLYEATVEVERTDIEDDILGIYAPIAQAAGHETAIKPSRDLAALMAAGTATLCYDGQNFFDTDHPVYANEDGTGAATTVSNYDDNGGVGGTAWYLLDCSRPVKAFIHQERMLPEFDTLDNPRTNDQVFMRDVFLYGVRYRMNVGFGLWQCAYRSEKPLTAANFEAAYTALQSIKRDGGEPMGIMPTHLVVPPGLRSDALKIAQAEFINGGDSNVNAKAVKPLVVPWLA